MEKLLKSFKFKTHLLTAISYLRFSNGRSCSGFVNNR